ncbi:MAG TPA: hypothetical protein V6D05_14595 [Stenomitos sp.]
MMFDGLLKGQPINQVFSKAVRPFAATDTDVQTAHQISPAQAAAVAALPAEIKRLNEGQTARFQSKSAEYYGKLVAQGKINPRTVTQEEFVVKAEPLAEKDPFSFNWLETAKSLLSAFKMVADVRISGNRERAEREDAIYQLQQVREIGLKQVEAHRTVMGRDQMLISPAALAVSRERAGK